MLLPSSLWSRIVWLTFLPSRPSRVRCAPAGALSFAFGSLSGVWRSLRIRLLAFPRDSGLPAPPPRAAVGRGEFAPSASPAHPSCPPFLATGSPSSFLVLSAPAADMRRRGSRGGAGSVGVSRGFWLAALPVRGSWPLLGHSPPFPVAVGERPDPIPATRRHLRPLLLVFFPFCPLFCPQSKTINMRCALFY